MTRTARVGSTVRVVHHTGLQLPEEHTGGVPGMPRVVLRCS